jgi:glycosyltransferase involved in cell wall biosynthesis
MTKILLITPRLQHYRLSFYEKLSSYKSDYHLTVFYGINDKEDGKAGYTGETKFSSRGFVEQKRRVLPFEVVTNPGMFSAMKKLDPDLIIFLASTGNLTYRKIVNYAHRKNKKVIIWTSGWDPGRAKKLLLHFKNKLVSSFYKKADYFLTYSTFANSYVESMGIDNSKIKICYNGIETDELVKDSDNVVSSSADLRKKQNLNNHLTFLYVGGLIPEKRVDLLIDSFVELHQKYSNIKLLIVGDGPLKGQVEDMLKRHKNPDMTYLGRVIQGVDSIFMASDCLVLPGAGGLALNQAMFWKKTCIVSKADGTEDDLVIENVTGYRFLENDKRSLIEAMERRILDSPEKVRIMSENSHRLIMEKSNVNNMVSVFSGAIDQLTER